MALIESCRNVGRRFNEKASHHKSNHTLDLGPTNYALFPCLALKAL